MKLTKYITNVANKAHGRFSRGNIRYCPLECKKNACMLSGNRRCLTCQQILSSQTFSFHSTGYIHYICGMQCVGEKEQSFNERMDGHRSDCTCKPYLPVHFRVRQPEHAKADIKNLTIIIIDHNEDRSNA